MNEENLRSVVTEVLQNTPQKPFLCLPMSAMLYAIISDHFKTNVRLITGNLLYKGDYIFKQDFSINSAPTDKYQEWAGHAWVETNGLICDLSFFRTLYSESFTKPCKSELIKTFGVGRGCIIVSPKDAVNLGLEYQPIDSLSDDMATAIIKGYETLLTFAK